MSKCDTPRPRVIAKITSSRMSPLQPQLLEPNYTLRHRATQENLVGFETKVEFGACTIIAGQMWCSECFGWYACQSCSYWLPYR
jgi:hypothetical protein